MQSITKLVLEWSEEGFFFLLLLGSLFITYESFNYQPDARIFPLIIVTTLNLVLTIQLLKLVVGRFRDPPADEPTREPADSGDDNDPFSMEHLSTETVTLERELRAAAWIYGFGITVSLLGFFIAIPIFLTLFLKIESELGVARILAFTAGIVVTVYLVFVILLNSQVYSGVLLGTLVLWAPRPVWPIAGCDISGRQNGR